MLAFMIFDHLNDIVYLHADGAFATYIENLAVTHGLLGKGQVSDSLENSDHENNGIDPNIVVQLFSPLITSQNIMGAQFGNSYQSIECKDGVLLMFEEYSNFIFVGIGHEEENFLRRYINIGILLVKVTVGPCVSLLKRDSKMCKSLDDLLNAWHRLYDADQNYLLEAAERLIINADISTQSIKALSAAIDQLKHCSGVTSGHALFYVKNKVMSLFSSPKVAELPSTDILILNLLIEADRNPSSNIGLKASNEHSSYEEEDHEDYDAENERNQDEPPDDNLTEPQTLEHDMKISERIIFMSNERCPLFPYLVFAHPVTPELSLVLVSEMNQIQVSGELIQLLSFLDSLKNNCEKSRGLVLLENIDGCLRKAQENAQWLTRCALLKTKRSLLKVSCRLDTLKKSGLLEWLRSGEESELPSRLEAPLSAVREAVLSSWQAVSFLFDNSPILNRIEAACKTVHEKMAHCLPMLEPSSLKAMSIESSSLLSINKYMEEFPGLVHFLYIDRTSHLLTAPVLSSSQNRNNDGVERVSLTQLVTRSKIWSMVEFARKNLIKGHLSLLWKDKTFSYSYFLWFEDTGGNPLLTESVTTDDLQTLPVPGILCGDFYRAFTYLAFPDIDPSKVRVYEMFCIHLGLATSPCILEQTRRLAATVWEITGHRIANPLDVF